MSTLNIFKKCAKTSLEYAEKMLEVNNTKITHNNCSLQDQFSWRNLNTILNIFLALLHLIMLGKDLCMAIFGNLSYNMTFSIFRRVPDCSYSLGAGSSGMAWCIFLVVLRRFRGKNET